MNEKINEESDLVEASEIKHLEAELQKLLTHEEIHWHQQSSIIWLQDGDHNTSYFHHFASVRKRRNMKSGLFYTNTALVYEP